MLRKPLVIGRVVSAFCLVSCINLSGFSQTSKSLSNRNGIVQERVAVEQEMKQLPTLSKIAATTSTDNDRLKETLVDLEKKSWEAWKNHDGKFFQDFLSDDHVEVGFGGSTDKAMVVKVVAHPTFCTVKSYSVDQFQLTVFAPNAALLTYHAAQDTTCEGNVVPSPVWASSLYIKRGSRWLNAAYQQTQTSK